MLKKTSQEISREIMEAVKKNIPQITNFRTGGVLRLFIEVVGEFIHKIYKELLDILPNIFCQSSSGEWLDSHSVQLDITRNPATKTRGKLTLFRENTEQNITIEKDKIFSTVLDSQGKRYRFKTIESTVFPKNLSKIEIIIEAEEAGSNYNVFENQIKEIITPISGVDRANNQNGWITVIGLDIETDNSLRARCLKQWQGLSGSNTAAYESWVKSVQGIETVHVIPVARGLGTIDILILGANNTTPSREIINDAQQAVDKFRPIGTDVSVKKPFENLINPTVNIQIYQDSIITEKLIEEKIDDFFKHIEIGCDFESSALIAKIFELEGMKSVAVTHPIRVEIEKFHIARKGQAVINIRSEIL